MNEVSKISGENSQFLMMLHKKYYAIKVMLVQMLMKQECFTSTNRSHSTATLTPSSTCQIGKNNMSGLTKQHSLTMTASWS